MGRVLIALVALSAVVAAVGHDQSHEVLDGAKRKLAATTVSTECQQAALYIIPALPNVLDASVFQLVRATYIDTVKGLAPAGAISDVIPALTEPNRRKGGISVHTTILFSGSCEAGKAAARALHVKLLGDVRPLFFVPAPNAPSLFGNVYMITVGFPYLADAAGAKLVAPNAPAGTNLAAQFSITWEDVPPSKIGEVQAAAFKAAILKQLPAGAGVYFTTMITQGVSHRFRDHWRANAAAVSAAAAKDAGRTSQGGSVWPPGQPATTKAGRLVFNTNIHGTVFNTAAGKVILTQFMQLLRSNAAAVFPPRHFGRMALEPGYGLRLVNDPAFPCECPVPPVLTLAQAFGPNSATAAASGAADTAWVRWRFTATPASGAGISQESDAPLVWWYNLAPSTQYTISVTGLTSSGLEVKGSNSLVISTSQAGALTIAAAVPSSATQARVLLTPPTGITIRAPPLYMVAVCLKAQPTNCVRQNSTSIQLLVTGLTAGAAYEVSAAALIDNKVGPASNTLPLVMPQVGAPTLLTAEASGALTGAATAAAPSSGSVSKYVFTAAAPSGAPNATSTVTDPLAGRFTGLSPATQYDVTVVGYTGSTPTPPSNSLSFVTPAANAPLNTPKPQSPTSVLVSVVPPTLPPINGGSWVTFDVTLCPVAGPQSACATKRVGGSRRRLLADQPQVRFDALPDTTYNSVTFASSQSGEQSKLSMPSQVTTPPIVPWAVTVDPNGVTQTTALVQITPPSLGGPWVSVVLTACALGPAVKPSRGTPNWDECQHVQRCMGAQLESCRISGLSANTAYAVSGVAYDAAGVASIRSAPTKFDTPAWPSPVIDEVVPGTVDLSSATVTITGPSLAPPGGYAAYNLTVCPVAARSGCTYPVCTPVRGPNDGPTTCTLTGLSEGTQYQVVAVAVKGSTVSTPSNTKSFETLTQDAPTLESVVPSGFTSGFACLKPPTLGPARTAFQCQSCYNNDCKAAPLCSAAPTRRLLEGCPDSITCSLGDGLESDTPYTVSCVALTADNVASPESNSLPLTTEQPPAPPVTPVASDPVLLSCSPSPGGPWATCVVNLCGQQPTRRRMLAQCDTPLQVSCAFTSGGSGPCTLNMTGLVTQGDEYAILNSTSVMADGVRKSLSAPQGTYSLAPFPKPTISVVNTGGIGSQTYQVTITPSTSTPLISFPAGGWTYYTIIAAAEINIDAFRSCIGVTNGNGVPQPVTCTVTVSQAGTPLQWTAQGNQGDPSNIKPTDLRTFDSEPYIPPAIVLAQSFDFQSGSVCVRPPLAVAIYTDYKCKACTGGVCGAEQSCQGPARRRLLGGSGGGGGGDCDGVSTKCWLYNLAASTQYNVTCVGIASSFVSGPSNYGSFTTSSLPPPP